MKYIYILSILFASCAADPMDVAVTEYCQCADKILAMDAYDYKMKGAYWQEKADTLHNKISRLADQGKGDIEALKKWVDCAGKISEASYQRRKELSGY